MELRVPVWVMSEGFHLTGSNRRYRRGSSTSEDLYFPSGRGREYSLRSTLGNAFDGIETLVIPSTELKTHGVPFSNILHSTHTNSCTLPYCIEKIGGCDFGDVLPVFVYCTE